MCIKSVQHRDLNVNCIANDDWHSSLNQNTGTFFEFYSLTENHNFLVTTREIIYISEYCVGRRVNSLGTLRLDLLH